ncbi:MAG: hypothetical protein Q9173_004209 [Seirophora scorigena]
MASRRNPPTAKKTARAFKQGKRPRTIEREQPRRSARLEVISRLAQSSHDKKPEQPSPNPAAGKVPKGSVAPQPSHILQNPSPLHRKRKRETAYSSAEDQDRPPAKQARSSSPSGSTEAEPQQEAESDISKDNAGPIETWIRTKRWPSQYFLQDDQVREDLERDSWLEEYMSMEESYQVVQYVEINGFRYPRPLRKLPTSLRRKQSDSSLASSDDLKRRESKSVPYRDKRYTTLLAAKGSYMDEFDDDIPKSTTDLCRTLLATEQIVPQDSLFRDDLFTTTCRKIADRNEARVVQDIARLIVPSAETLATYGARNLNHLIESTNEGWYGSIAVHGPRPQPDYSVGFRRSAFTPEQLNKFDPFIGTVWDTSFFVATYRMYFPFLTCEVKCGASALDVADRQNAHSMTIAVRAIVELYRAMKREKELHREILAFSISHDHSSVRIYGHYAIIEGRKTTFYRHPIHRFDFTALDGKDKWTAYKFCKTVYNDWMPIHLKRICSVIDQLPPNINFELSQGSEFHFTEASMLSREMGGLLSKESDAECASRSGQDDSEMAPTIPQTVTPETSVSQGKEQAALKRPKRKHAAK